MALPVCANAASPLQLPWTTSSISINGLANARGLSFTIGTPGQFFSLKPGVDGNNTFVFDAVDCITSTNYSCIASVGGVYNYSASHTSVSTNIEGHWNGTAGDPATGDGNSYVFFNDYIQFGSTGSIYGFPFYTDTAKYADRQGSLSLGLNSSFINAAVASELAPAKQWSLWSGSQSDTAPTDGMVIIGGYDAARSAGEDFVDFITAWNAPLEVKVTGMTYDDPNGTSTSIFAIGQEYMWGTLEPFSNWIQVSEAMYFNFARATNAISNFTNLPTPYLIYPYETRPNGTVTVTISSPGGQEYLTQIPASEMFQYPKSWSNQGDLVVNNYNYVEGQLGITNTTEYTAWIGIPFLTQNYVLVDYESGSYKMAKANTAASLSPTIKAFCSGTPTTTTSTSSASSSPSQPPASSSIVPVPPPHHKTPIGAIVGGVVGGVAVLILLGVLLFCLRRRSRRDREGTRQAEVPPTTHGAPVIAPHTPPPAQPQMVKRKPTPSEVTDTTYTEVSELPSPGVHQVNNWLQNQPNAYTHEKSAAVPHRDPLAMNATSGPIEMPAHYND